MNKFIKYYDLINSFIEKYNYRLYCGGINPNYRKINRKCLNQNRYRTIERLLKTNKKNIFSEFCSYCCSIQTHINTSQEELVNTINMFTKIEDIKTKIFANSYMDELNLKNSRKYLWEHCNFGPHNSGKNKIYKSLEELKRSYLYRDLFFVERKDKFLLLNEKIPVYKYLKEKELDATDGSLKDIKVVPNIDDLDNFRSYKSVEVTRFGTLEIRTDCTQSFEKIFKVVAFNVGVAKKCNEILEYLKKNKRISTKKLLEYACLGLKERGKEEEILLKE